MGECKNCANMDNEYCFACDDGNQFKPMTNADRIRSMSDEELAFYIVNHPKWSDESACLRWLKERAE